MKVLHVPFSFHPDPVGGTEVYVEALARQQQLDGMDTTIAAPGIRQEQYDHGSVTVWRFPVAECVDDLRELYGEGDVMAAAAFGRILDDERPDVVHVHAFTRGVSVRLVRQAKLRDVPVVFSYHTPTVTCQRGTLLRWGIEACDGTLDLKTCTQCSLCGLGLNRVSSVAAGWIPRSVGRLAGSAGLSGGMWTAVRMTELVALRHAAFRSLVAEVDHIVAMCQWVKDLLLGNGVPAERITMSRQGLWQCEHSEAVPSNRIRQNGSPLKIIFVGRLDQTKGAHVLIDALKAAPGLPVTLDIYGVTQGEAGAAYLTKLKQSADSDRRITFQPSIPSADVVTRMRDYDVIAVPSQWLETGPLVVMEAFAAGLPVIGSNLGGIAELVTDEVDGLLVTAQSVAAWRAAIERVCRDPALLSRLREQIRQPRCIRDVALDMSILYASLPRKSRAHSPLDPLPPPRCRRQRGASPAEI